MSRRARRGLRCQKSASAAFLPTSLSGLLFWVRADLGVTIGTGVSAWADQSGTGDTNKNLVQGTGANQPTFNASDAGYNNKPTLTFDGTNDVLVSGAWAASQASPFTVYIVGNTNGADGQYLFSASGALDQGPWGFGRDNTGAGGTLGSLSVYNGAQINSTSGSAPVLSAASVISVVFNGASSAGYVSMFSTSYVSGNAGSESIIGFRVGSRRDGAGLLNGKVAEVAIYSSAHDAATRTTVMTYLGTRYGITVT